MSIYTYSNSEDYFKNILKSHRSDHGYKTKLAKVIQVHPSYITKVCKGSALLNPDQACSLADFWGLNADEKEYFLWLTFKTRAAQPAFKKIVEQKLLQIKEQKNNLADMLPAEKVNPNQDSEYYISWIYSAVHMLLTLQTPPSLEMISRRLSIKLETVQSAVTHLLRMGLVEKKSGEAYRASQKNMHLSNKNWLASLHHRNWRSFTSERISRMQMDLVTYTSVHSLSKKDLEKLKRQIHEFLLQTDQLVRPSPEETACVLCIDLAEL
ncbi:MAG: TIGR02147 family protein [Pseudobdellovibrionaceae bacterium]